MTTGSTGMRLLTVIDELKTVSAIGAYVPAMRRFPSPRRLRNTDTRDGRSGTRCLIYRTLGVRHRVAAYARSNTTAITERSLTSIMQVGMVPSVGPASRDLETGGFFARLSQKLLRVTILNVAIFRFLDASAMFCHSMQGRVPSPDFCIFSVLPTCRISRTDSTFECFEVNDLAADSRLTSPH
jgi:hypothetical protein